MSVTKRGKIWETTNSLWIIWSFICALNYVGFFWIGIRARQKKWIFTGVVYFIILFIFPMVGFRLSGDNGFIGGMVALIYLAGYIVCIVHSFRVRNEYLIRREALLDSFNANKDKYRDKIRDQYADLRQPETVGIQTISSNKIQLERYLANNQSTPFFREKIGCIIERLGIIDSSFSKIDSIIKNRFCPTGLSYGTFAAPVEALKDYAINSSGNLIARMNVFNEKVYSDRIDEFMKSNRNKEAEDYLEVMQQYKDFAEKALAALDDAILRLDRLTLELSKLSEADIEKAQNIMNSLDEAIQNTQLYK